MKKYKKGNMDKIITRDFKVTLPLGFRMVDIKLAIDNHIRDGATTNQEALTTDTIPYSIERLDV